MALGLALKFVLEALKQEPNTKMYMFGLAALDKFKSRLKDCAQYCQHIVAIAHFGQFPAQLAEVGKSFWTVAAISSPLQIM